MSDPMHPSQPGQWRPGDAPQPGSPYAPASLGAAGATSAGRTALVLAIVALVCWLGLEFTEQLAFRTANFTRTVYQVLRLGGWVGLILALVALGVGIHGLRRPGPHGRAGVATGIAIALVTSWVLTRVLAAITLQLG